MKDTEQGSPTTEKKVIQANKRSSLSRDTTILPDPGDICVISRDFERRDFDVSRIRGAIEKAFVEVRGLARSERDSTQNQITAITDTVVNRIYKRYQPGGVIHIEDIQNAVIANIMGAGYMAEATCYSKYRQQHEVERETERLAEGELHQHLRVKQEDGSYVPLDWEWVELAIDEACAAIPDVSEAEVMEGFKHYILDEMEAKLVDFALIASTRAMIEREPNYDTVAARLLQVSLRKTALKFLDIRNDGPPLEAKNQQTLGEVYREVFRASILKGIELELLNPQLEDFNLNLLGGYLVAERDFMFTYLGLQTLYDSYLMHSADTRYELPQVLFMRVAMGLALNEPNRDEMAVQFYELLSTFQFVCSTPTLFNSGTPHSQLSSCYLTTVPDDLDGIFGAIKDNALLSKWAGGLGNDWTPVRAKGAYIKGTNGKSEGVAPFLKVADATAIAVNQGGKRHGAVCAYLETWHLDIKEFLDLRKNTGDERRRTHDMHTANWIPDLFMKRVFEEQKWTLFSPATVPDLHDLYGKAFEQRYEEYERMTKTGEITLFKEVEAKTLWSAMLKSLIETGHPWPTFKDPCNLRSPQRHIGVVHSSNLCTEITLNTSADEIAVCNLGSINLVEHIGSSGKIDHNKLKQTIQTAIRMLDNVIDTNYYAVDTARNSNMRHRPIGLGLMGFHDALLKKRIPYGSEAAVEFADESMEAISYYAIEASSDLAVKRGAYSSYQGSLWSQGIFPIDSLRLLQEERGSKYLSVNFDTRLPWDELRQKVATQGMRNSNVMAIAPTATISNIVGVTQSIEPTFRNLYVKSNKSGVFTAVNKYLANELKNLDLWNPQTVDHIKASDGSVAQLEGIPDETKALYAIAFEISPKWLVEAASRRQKWLDQSQSLNFYLPPPRDGITQGRALDVMYRMAWLLGLKSTYYFRSLAATQVEPSTLLRDDTLNAVDRNLSTEQAIVSPSPISAATVQSKTNANRADNFDLSTPQNSTDACSLDADCDACQ